MTDAFSDLAQPNPLLYPRFAFVTWAAVQDRIAPRSRPSVLIVDDEPFIVDILQRFLQSADYAIFTASNGIEALECVRAKRPQIVLLDRHLPGKDGFAVLEEIRKEFPEIAVVMITADDGEEFKTKASALGIVEYITKPFNLHDVKEVLLRNLSRGNK